MGEMKYSFFQLLFGDEETFWKPEKTYKRLSAFGYSGLEITPPKGQHGRGISMEKNARTHLALKRDFNMDIVCVNECWGRDWDPNVPAYKTMTDREGANLSISETKSTIDFAKEVEAPFVTLTAVIKNCVIENAPEAYDRMIDTLKTIGEYAAQKGIQLVFEATNHLEVGRFINTVRMHKQVIARSGLANVGIQLDTFHANIEELGIYEAIINAEPLLWHIHFRDSNGLIPGYGNIDFKAALRALKKIEYSGYCTIEATCMGADIDRECKQGIEYMKQMEQIADYQLSADYPNGYRI